MKRSDFLKSLPVLFAAPLVISETLKDKEPEKIDLSKLVCDHVRITSENHERFKGYGVGDLLVSDKGHAAVIHNISLTARNEIDVSARTIDGKSWNYNNFFAFRMMRKVV
jgi:hypothetical protein